MAEWRRLIQGLIAVESPHADWQFCSRTTSTAWWDYTIMQTRDDQQWVQNFIMRKATFLELCDELDSTLLPQETQMRETSLEADCY